MMTAFDGARLLARGAPPDIAVKLRDAVEAGAKGPLLVFDDVTGKVVDIDLRGDADEVRARYSVAIEAGGPGEPERSRGRPRLGVIAREVTLLPRHWEWLATQSGGASAVLRRLIDEARRKEGDEGRMRSAREAAWRFMMAIAGDLPGFEEASRALFAGDQSRFRAEAAAWPPDIRAHAMCLAWGDD
ncbi:DUF2239 family protein [Zavarzinia sp.]|uniref:DUF2239 family protein n=1 Tax=Zavarzinia sp. TaxID=2027920 RepID=UPI003BB4A117